MKASKKLLTISFVLLTAFTSNSCAALMAGLASGAMNLDAGSGDLNLTASQPVPYRAEASNGIMEPTNGGKIYGHY